MLMSTLRKLTMLSQTLVDELVHLGVLHPPGGLDHLALGVGEDPVNDGGTGLCRRFLLGNGFLYRGRFRSLFRLDRFGFHGLWLRDRCFRFGLGFDRDPILLLEDDVV